VSESTAAAIGSTAPGHYGAAGSSIVLGEVTIATAWNVQGDAKSPSLNAELQRIAGVALPAIANTTSRGESVVALWLGPQSWLLVAGAAARLGDFSAARGAGNDRGIP